jgi:CBS domain-containing protein
MKVIDVMTGTPFYCDPQTNLGSAAELLWNQNCGILPIVDNQKVVGVVTDRDLFIALGTRNRLPGDITVGEVSSGRVHLCYADDDIHAALETMAREKVRRLPVIDRKGVLRGILSMDDMILRAEAPKPGARPDLSYEDVMRALRKIYSPETPLATQGRAAASA